MADATAVEGEWLIAERQTGGRGRQGREWRSLPGNFHGSVLITVQPGDPQPTLLSLACGVALHEAVAAVAPDAALQLKWPNDLLLDGVKLGGILIEREGDRIVAGFGVNLAEAPSLDRPATALARVATVSVEAFAPLIAGAMDRLLGQWRADPGSLLASWLERAHPVGTALTVHSGPGEAVSGSFAGLDSGGALILRLADGGTRVIHAGDAFLA